MKQDDAREVYRYWPTEHVSGWRFHDGKADAYGCSEEGQAGVEAGCGYAGEGAWVFNDRSEQASNEERDEQERIDQQDEQVIAFAYAGRGYAAALFFCL
jgi:hypothetical protein